jgi:hypothetical protein
VSINYREHLEACLNNSFHGEDFKVAKLVDNNTIRLYFFNSATLDVDIFPLYNLLHYVINSNPKNKEIIG